MVTKSDLYSRKIILVCGQWGRWIRGQILDWGEQKIIIAWERRWGLNKDSNCGEERTYLSPKGPFALNQLPHHLYSSLKMYPDLLKKKKKINSLYNTCPLKENWKIIELKENQNSPIICHSKITTINILWNFLLVFEYVFTLPHHQPSSK